MWTQPAGTSLLALLLLVGALIVFEVFELFDIAARSGILAIDPSIVGNQGNGAALGDALLPPSTHPTGRGEVLVSEPVPARSSRQGVRKLAPSGSFPSWVPAKQVPIRHRRGIYQYTHAHGDLPLPLPHLRPTRKSPVGWTKEKEWYAWKEWDNSIAICACMFQEHMEDVREWLLYHQWLGVDHVYLYENSDPPPAHVSEQLIDFVASGFVTFEAVGKPASQLFIYHACATQHRHKQNWLAFIDIDEFIVLRRKNTSLKLFLDGFRNEAALGINWILVGPSHQDARPHEGVLRSYTECVKTPHPLVKSIANTYFLANIADQPHTFEYRDNRPTVDSRHRKLGWRFPPPKACVDGTVPYPELDMNCRPVWETGNPNGKVDDLAVFHYLTKSKEDYMAKMARGGGAGNFREWSHYRQIERKSSRGGICEEPAQLAEHCCAISRFVLPPRPPAKPVAMEH